jgi:hypothetical protein
MKTAVHHLALLLTILLSHAFLVPNGRTQSNGSEVPFQPDTVMVSDFIFTRPPDWTWVSSETNRPGVQKEVIFSVANRQQKDAVMAYISHFPAKAAPAAPRTTATRWKSWFEHVTDSSPLSDPVSLGPCRVFYTRMTGMYRGPSQQSDAVRSNYSLFGAIIEHPKGNIIMRIVGPAPLVEKKTNGFRVLIEQTLKSE